jgi:lipoprotein
MKQIILLTVIMVAMLAGACHETTIGYLTVKNASYKPDTLYIRKTPDPKLDALRIENNAPWISSKLQGYKGTAQIYFSIDKVTSELGEEAAMNFMKNLTIRGGGALTYPLENDAVPGIYKVSVRLTNTDYSKVVEDSMTIVVTE